MSNIERLVTDFRRFINRPFASMNDWKTEKDFIVGSCVHGRKVESCFTCNEYDNLDWPAKNGSA